MELVDSLEEMFQWQTPFCGTLLNDVMGSEGTIPSLDAMLVDIEFPEMNLGTEPAPPATHPNPLSRSLSICLKLNPLKAICLSIIIATLTC